MTIQHDSNLVILHTSLENNLLSSEGSHQRTEGSVEKAWRLSSFEEEQECAWQLSILMKEREGVWQHSILMVEPVINVTLSQNVVDKNVARIKRGEFCLAFDRHNGQDLTA